MRTITETFTKKQDGNIYLRQVEKEQDINSVEFTTRDVEVLFHYRKHLVQLRDNLREIREEISELEKEETRLVTRIAAIIAARDS